MVKEKSFKIRFFYEGKEHKVETKDERVVSILRNIFTTGYVADDASILQVERLNDE